MGIHWMPMMMLRRTWLGTLDFYHVHESTCPDGFTTCTLEMHWRSRWKQPRPSSVHRDKKLRWSINNGKMVFSSTMLCDMTTVKQEQWSVDDKANISSGRLQ